MSYPSLPFALVHFLASVSAERLSLDNSASQITIVAQHDKSTRARRLEISDESHWQSVLTNAVAMVAEKPTDTLTILYPSSDGAPVDVGVLIEGGKPPMVFSWTFGPAFQMLLIEEGETRNMVLNGAGVQETQAILDRIHGSPGKAADVLPSDVLPAEAPSSDVLTILAPDGSKLD